MQHDAGQAPEVFDFVCRFLEDLEAGQPRALTEYLERFPGHEEAIVREWLALQDRGDEQLAATPQTPARRGTERIAHYRLVRELGRGGQGLVYLAVDERLGRRVALKVLRSPFLDASSDALQRFAREAEVVAQLEHPGLCGVYEANLEGQVPYLAMRHVPGLTLSALMQAAREDRLPAPEPPAGGLVASQARWASDLDTLLANAEGSLDRAMEASVSRNARMVRPTRPLTLEMTLRFFEKVARALHAAHEAGIVHRDVKPGNLMVCPDGEPVVLDFGHARFLERGTVTLTQPGDAFGTLAYMAPEQLDESLGDVDRRTDVHALGVTLFECLTGTRPFDAPSPEALFVAVRSQEAPDARTRNAAIPDDLHAVLQRCLRKDAAGRYATALDLARDLHRVRELEPVSAGAAAPRALSGPRPRPWSSVAIGVLALALVAVTTLWLAERSTRRREFASALAGEAERIAPADPRLGRLLAREAHARDASTRTRSAWLVALAHAAEAAPSPAWPHEQDDEPVSALAFGPGGDVVAFARGPALVVHDRRDGARVVLGQEQPVPSPVCALALAPATGGVLVAAACEDGRVRLWDARRGVPRVLEAPGAALLDVAFLAGGARLAATAGSAVLLWDAPYGAVLATLDHGAARVTALAAAASGALATGASDRRTRVWTPHGELAAECFDWEPTEPPTWRVRALACDARGVPVFSADEDGRVKRWTLDPPRLAAAAALDAERLVLAGDGGALWALERGGARVVRLDPQTLATRQIVDAARVTALVAGPRDEVLIADASGRVTVVRGGEVHLSAHLHEAPIAHAVFAPDGTAAATADEAGVLRVWPTDPQAADGTAPPGPLTRVERELYGLDPP